jgi:hypothetical protein
MPDLSEVQETVGLQTKELRNLLDLYPDLYTYDPIKEDLLKRNHIIENIKKNVEYQLNKLMTLQKDIIDAINNLIAEEKIIPTAKTFGIPFNVLKDNPLICQNLGEIGKHLGSDEEKQIFGKYAGMIQRQAKRIESNGDMFHIIRLVEIQQKLIDVLKEHKTSNEEKPFVEQEINNEVVDHEQTGILTGKIKEAKNQDKPNDTKSNKANLNQLRKTINKPNNTRNKNNEPKTSPKPPSYPKPKP